MSTVSGLRLVCLVQRSLPLLLLFLWLWPRPVATAGGAGAVGADMAGVFQGGCAVGNVVFVDADATGANNGTSWADAFTDLEDALATTSSGEIWVAEGSYFPSQLTDPFDPKTATFTLKNCVALYGGFAGTETTREERDWVAHLTLLSGDIGIPGARGDNSLNVLTSDNTDMTALLDGFTVADGSSEGPFGGPNSNGGGLHNEDGSPTLTNLIFTRNNADVGGGMINSDGSPTLTHVTFTDNTAGDGGGLYSIGGLPTLTDVAFVDNTANGWGGGMYNSFGNAILTRVAFTNNSANTGGGFYNIFDDPTLTFVSFTNNLARFADTASTRDAAGGGMYNLSGNPMLTNVTFSGNLAGKGGGIYNEGGHPAMVNVAFVNNSAGAAGGDGNGGAVYNLISIGTGLALTPITNVTIANNTATTQGGGVFTVGSIGGFSNLVLQNSIVFGNTPDDLTGTYTETNTLSGSPDPLFVDATSGDLHLQAASPAIDAGDNSLLPVDTFDLDDDGDTTEPLPVDLDGNKRVVDGNGDGTEIVDQGAFEFCTSPCATGTVTIIKDSQPNSVQNFHFTGDLGAFRLDNVIPDDGDAYTQTQSFVVATGIYTVTEQVPGNWLLSDIRCDPASSSTVDLVNNQAVITLNADSHVTCTFTNQRKAKVRAFKYEDLNGNAIRNRGESPLAGWTILLYDAAGVLVPTVNNLTNVEGKVAYTGLTPGNYTVCEELRARWINTDPGLIDPVYAQPCYHLTVGPGQIGVAHFGNVDHPVASTAQPQAAQRILVFTAPDVEADEAHYDAVDTDEAWLNSLEWMGGLLLPSILAD